MSVMARTEASFFQDSQKDSPLETEPLPEGSAMLLLGNIAADEIRGPDDAKPALTTLRAIGRNERVEVPALAGMP
jgi:hypothetical protein